MGIRNLLQKEGVKVVYAEDSTITKLKEAKDEFLSGIKKGDVVIIFFAGHGFEFNNVNRLMAISEHDKTDFRRDSLNLLYLLMQVQEKGARISVAMLDCCRE